MNEDDLRESFDHFDRDGDGFIDVREFGDLCRALGGEIEETQRDLGFAEIDTNGDGAIDFAEFAAWRRDQL